MAKLRPTAAIKPLLAASVGLSIATAAIAQPAGAQNTPITPVFVEAGEIGQGFLLKRLDSCYLITPEHVVKDNFFANLTAANAARSKGEAVAIQNFGYDLSIMGVSGPATDDCGASFNQLTSTSADVLKQLQSASQLSVSTVSADGARTLTPVSISSVDLLRLYVQPIDAINTPLYQGMSGSTVYVGQTPVGMLQSVDADSGQGLVLRIDRLLETIGPFFNDGLVADLANNTGLNALQQSVTLSAWSHAPSAGSNSNLLTDGDTATHWSYQPQQGPNYNKLGNYQAHNPVRLTFSLGDNLQQLNSITLANHSKQRSSFIRDFEILANRSERSAQGWVPVYSGTWMLGQEQKEIDLSKANVAARQFMLVVHSHWQADAEQIVISEVKTSQSLLAE